MNAIVTNQTYLALNQGRYFSRSLMIPRLRSGIFITAHAETAVTDLPHYHDAAHLSFVLTGGVIDKRRQTEDEKSAGDLMYFRAGEIHQSIYRGFPVKSINIELEADFFIENLVSETDFCAALNSGPNAKFTLLKIYREMSVGDNVSASSTEMLLLSLMSANEVLGRSVPSWLARIAELLHDNWNEDLSVIDLANAVGVHPKTVSKYFPHYFNCTFGEYRRRLKVERALTLIKNSNESLTDIAYHCGFYDQSHFAAIFKQLTGYRPNQFKKL